MIISTILKKRKNQLIKNIIKKNYLKPTRTDAN